MPDNSTMAQALARIPSGCAVLTAATSKTRTAMLASWIQQVSFEPLAVSVAVRKGRPIESIIDESGRFVLNLVGEDPTPMFRHFGRGFGPNEEAFTGLKTSDVEGGVALNDAIAVISCERMGKFDGGDHWLYVGRVTSAATTPDARPYVHLRKNGLSY